MLHKKTKTMESKPPVAINEFSIVMTADEIVSVIQILSFSADLFEQMAVNSAKEGNEKAKQQFLMRAQLSVVLYGKFRALADIGEPTSREIH